MAMYWLLLSFFIAGAYGEVRKCSTYNFENNFEYFANEGTFCEPFPAWSVGYYTSVDIDRWNDKSVAFVYPGSQLSCIASFPFRMSGGVFEANVFVNSSSVDDHLTAVLMLKNPNGADAALNTQILHKESDNLDGWYTLKLNVHMAIGEFEGYIAFLGSVSEESTILVDSFRFMTAEANEADCDIYGDEDNSIEPVVVTEPPPLEDHCVTYNFEDDFEVKFTHDNYLCNGLMSWHLENYTSHDLVSPNPDSEFFIAPREVLSCIASDTFVMSPNGKIEANVYMESVSELDHIIVLAQRKRENDLDAVVGTTMYYPANINFIEGWNVLSFVVRDLTQFEGYLLLFGSALDGHVLVDSLRYIPPDASGSDDNCALYH